MNIDPISPPEIVSPADVHAPRFSWRLFWLLALSSLLASLLLVPYALQIAVVGNPGLDPRAAQVATSIGIVIQTILLYWPMTLVGLFVAARLGLGAPALQAIVEGRKAGALLRQALRPGLITGVAVGVVLLALSYISGPINDHELARLGIEIPTESLPNAFQGFFASISAGINEEILLRLFLLSIVAWTIQRLAQRRSSGRPARSILWTANILSAVIFGLLHLPNLIAMGVPITPFFVGYVLVLNGLAGLAFGWLYWTYGLESAMLAHFFTDIVLHVISVPLQSLFS